MVIVKLKIIKLPLEHLLWSITWVLIICKNLFVLMWKKWYFVLLISMHGMIVVWCLCREVVQQNFPDYDSKSNMDEQLQQNMELDKGRGCQMPLLDPFSPEVTQFDKKYPKVTCNGQNWVKCYHSECKVIEAILDTHTDIICTYRDLIYISDDVYAYGAPVVKAAGSIYYLRMSDYAGVECSAFQKVDAYHSKTDHIKVIPVLETWIGQVAGFRSLKIKPSHRKQENATNVLIFAFESTPRTGFIRNMPKSYKFLTEVLNATVLKSYNIVGDGTHSALLPILMGQNPFELPNANQGNDWMNDKITCDQFPLIFYTLAEDGYQTAFFEDDVTSGTFQYRYVGFRRQPTDHYIRPLIMEVDRHRWGWRNKRPHCLGDTPNYKLLMDLTNQYLHLKGKKFIFTFVAELSHEDFRMIATTDDDFIYFLQQFVGGEFMKDTMLIVMGDHGPRYYSINPKYRDTWHGRLEERLPFMAIVLPQKFKVERPASLAALHKNVDTLTTPHDIYSTLLDAVGLREYWNPYTVPGADMPRGLSLLEVIPLNRSCSEAGVTPHWCACLPWEHVPQSDPAYEKASLALLRYINDLTEPYRKYCLRRTLTAVRWVMKAANAKTQQETYQVKMTVGPGVGDFEATMTYLVDSDTFFIDIREISRTNLYKDEPRCISKSQPHLIPYCYCQT